MANPLLSLAAAAARWLPASMKRALYRLGPGSSALRSMLNRAAPKGLIEIEVAGGLLAGVPLWLDLQTEKDYWLGTYELDLQQAVHDLAKPGMVAYDLGANIGYISFLLAKEVGSGGKVFAFEPLPANQERLRKNMFLNPTLKIELIPKAVAEASGNRQFLVHNSGGMGKIEGAEGREMQYRNMIDVDCVALDDFVFKQGNPNPNLVKIDVEGGEGLALQGMIRLLQETKPLFIIELHGQKAAETCWEILTKAAYNIRNLAKGNQQVSDGSKLDWKSYILAKPNA